MDSHARFNLSPVPSVEGDEDDEINDGVGHPTHRGLAKIDQNDSGEDAENQNKLHTSTTAVQLYDSNNGPSSPITDQSNVHHGLFLDMKKKEVSRDHLTFSN